MLIAYWSLPRLRQKLVIPGHVYYWRKLKRRFFGLRFYAASMSGESGDVIVIAHSLRSIQLGRLVVGWDRLDNGAHQEGLKGAAVRFQNENRQLPARQS